MSLQVHDLSFHYRKSNPVLEQINLQVAPGEVLGLLGPNGTGKTTLLKCIQHVLIPQQGTVSVDGTDIRQLHAKQRAKLIAYVPQSLQTVFPISVVDFVFSGRTPFLSGRPKEQDQQIVFDALKRLGLEDFAFRSMGEMSGGERQRVLLARALAQTPRILLLDEPTASLDLNYQLSTLQLVTQLAREEQLAVIISIHDLNLATLCCDRLLMMKGSHVFCCGSPSEVMTEEHIATVYGVHTEVSQIDDLPHIRLLPFEK